MPTAKKAEKKAEESPDVAEKQFPSLSGAKAVEVAERTGDTDEAKSDVFVKKFYVLKRDWDLSGGHAEMHDRNIGAMRQAAINQGLRPTGDGVFDGHEIQADADSVVLRYVVPVTPAAVAKGAHVTVQQDQEGSNA